MSSNARLTPNPAPMAFGEDRRVISPEGTAHRILNFIRTPEGTLRTVRGPCPFEPTDDTIYSRMHGIFFHDPEGVDPVLLMRAGGILFKHEGCRRDWTAVATGLSDDTTRRQADQFVVIPSPDRPEYDQIIWSNGIDRPLMIRPDGRVIPLGFDRAPGPPQVDGPVALRGPDSDDDNESLDNYFANTLGVWPGEMGTVGDVLAPEDGAVLSGTWYHAVQLVDEVGNLSPISPRSGPCVVTHRSSQEKIGSNNTINMTVDDLRIQAMVRVSGDNPNHTAGVYLLRTSDTQNVEDRLRILAFDPAARPAPYPDRKADAALGPEAFDVIPVPTFHVMCEHAGCLVIAVGSRYYVSERGYPGTFRTTSFGCVNGVITGLTSYGGRLLVYTASALFDGTDLGQTPVKIAGIGCVANRTIQTTTEGALIWLTPHKGFYMLPGPESLQPEAISRNIHRLVTEQVNSGALVAATSAIDPVTGAYRCWVAPHGSVGRRLCLVFDGGMWQELDLGYDVADICTLPDDGYQLIAAYDTSAAKWWVYTLDHEIAAADYTPPSRNFILESRWFSTEDAGVRPEVIRELLLGILDRHTNAVTIELFQNGSWSPVATTTFLAIGHDEETSTLADAWGTGVLGTMRARDPRSAWQRVSPHLEDARTWAFRISGTYPAEVELFMTISLNAQTSSGDPLLRNT